ncbi:MAG: N-methyl-L-tryptophan oxidase [Pseudomonadota bacterium]
MPKIAVIGAGMAGSSAAMHLAKRGAKVTLFDQFAFGHDKGSSHGATRLFRTAYFEHPNYVPILQRALSMWKAFEQEAGETLFHQTGVLEAGPPEGFLLTGLRAAIKEHDLPVLHLSAKDLKRDHPLMSLPPSFEAIFEHEAGFVLAGKTVAHQIRLAREHGALLRPETQISSWEARAGGVALVTGAGEEIFDRLVIAAGAFANSLLNLPQATVTPVPKTLFWRRPDTDQFDLGKGFAPFGVETAGKRFFYGFPSIDADGVKIAEHTGGQALARPEDRRDDPVAGEHSELDAFLSATIPALAGRPGRHQSCLYDVSSDHHFLIDRHPASDRVVFAAGLSGHGFKFAPVLGETLAFMALEDKAPSDWEFLSLKRFS